MYSTSSLSAYKSKFAAVIPEQGVLKSSDSQVSILAAGNAAYPGSSGSLLQEQPVAALNTINPDNKAVHNLKPFFIILFSPLKVFFTYILQTTIIKFNFFTLFFK